MDLFLLYFSLLSLVVISFAVLPLYLIFLSVWQCGWTGAELLCSLLYRLHGISLPSLLSLFLLGFTLSMSIYCVSWGSASLMIIMLVHGGTTFRASSCFYFLGLCCCPLYFFQKRKN